MYDIKLEYDINKINDVIKCVDFFKEIGFKSRYSKQQINRIEISREINDYKRLDIYIIDFELIGIHIHHSFNKENIPDEIREIRFNGGTISTRVYLKNQNFEDDEILYDFNIKIVEEKFNGYDGLMKILEKYLIDDFRDLKLKELL